MIGRFAERHRWKLLTTFIIGLVALVAVFGVRSAQLTAENASLTAQRDYLVNHIARQQCLNAAAIYTARFNRAPGQEC
jgi:S-adenosylmethionine:diacylglycerol 3-amino-3-carboxypropyl transferase